MSLTLYYHPLSSYCHKVLIALYEAGTAFNARVIDLGDADQREALRSHWPLCKFPVLHESERNRSLPESSVDRRPCNRSWEIGSGRHTPTCPAHALF